MTYQSPGLVTSKKALEFENFLSPNKQQLLLDYFLQPAFPWALTIDAVQGTDNDTILSNDSVIGMYHTFVYDGRVCSNYFEPISWVLDEFAKFKIYKNDIFRVRAGLFFKHPSSQPHVCHLDAKFPHTTAVYYVNDCDGDLVIYNETVKSHPWINPQIPTELCRIQPKQGKLAVFDGNHYHSSSYPNQKPLRLAITFNFSSELNM